MKFLSLFSGIGGFDLGLERAGMECVGQVELDPYCQAVLKKHWPDVKRMEGIHDVKGNEFGTVDVVCGGYPCQPFSQVGRRSGFSDKRHLWPDMFRLVKEIKPFWVVGENTIGHLRLGLDMVLNDLETLGYSTRAFDIPACSVGTPHKRSRTWVVAHMDNTSGRRYGMEKEEVCTGRNCSVNSSWWSREPAIRRVVDGVPTKLDKNRLKMIGNSVVPQVIEKIGKAIMETHLWK